jgi:tetratricopeptide (TPR) repeat protein
MGHMGLSGWFVGFGVGKYANPLHQRLPRACRQVEDLAALVAGDLVAETLLNPTEDQVRTRLTAVPEASGGGRLVLMWAGHGKPAAGGGLRLLTAESGVNVMAGLAVDEVVGKYAESGVNQLLVVLDTCFSAGGVASASDVAGAVMALVPPQGRVWVGVLASCQEWETAQDGVFGDRLLELIKNGPKDERLRRPWSKRNEFLRGEDIGDALLREWDSDEQHLSFRRDGVPDGLIRNPWFEPDAPAEVVEHLLRAARSGGNRETRSWFTGRTGEVDTVVGWVQAAVPGLRVVTGSAGTGKSAVTGRVVSLSVPVERHKLLGQGPLGHTDPGEGSVSGHVYLRGLTADQAARALDRSLIAGGVLAADEAGDRNAALLVGAVQRRAEAGGSPLVVVVDGLDEARAHAFPIARELLTKLSAYAVVVVSTREMVEPGQELPTRLVDTLQPVETLDLDDPRWAESGRTARRDYLVGRLTGADPRMDPGAVAEYLTKAAVGSHDQPFLLARLVADRLTVTPVDTTVPGWEGGVAGSIYAAVDAEIDRIEVPGHRDLDGTAAAGLARRMLTALTWGLGGGLPEEEWVTVASVLSADLGVTDLRAVDVSWMLEALGRFIVQDGQFGTAVYRVAHQSLSDYLRLPFTPSAQALFDPATGRVANALLTRYRRLLEAGIPATSPGYLWQYAWRHAAAAGPDGLTLIRQLSHHAGTLTPDVAMTALAIADVFRTWGRRAEALPLAQEAVDLYRSLAADNQAFLPDLASSLSELGVRFSDLGRRPEALPPIKEAVELYRGLAAENPAFVPGLARSLSNLGVGLSDLGRRSEALPATQEAVHLVRGLSRENPAFVPDLAGFLNNLGVALSDMGRRSEALPATHEAVELYRSLAADNQAFLPELGMSLGNLGVQLAGLGGHDEALAATQEGVEVYRGLAEANPAHVPELAKSVGNLGNRLAGMGRHDQALAPTQEAVDLYRGLAADNEAFLPDLAMSVGNLGIRLADMGGQDQALAPTQEAIDLYRGLAADNPAFLPDLARSLNNLGIQLADMGRHDQALPPTQEAVELYRGLAADNPAFLPSVAKSVSTLGIQLAGLGGHDQALAATQEAVELYRGLAAENQVFLPDLAGSLNNLGVQLAGLGGHDQALPATQEAVDLYRSLAAGNPAFVPDLGMSLTNLGIQLADMGRHDQALPPTQEAVGLYRGLAADNTAFLPSLAKSVSTLGIRLAQMGGQDQALPATQEAVDLYRNLAAGNPAFLPDLAGSLDNLGIQLADMGQYDQALPATQGSVELYRSLAADNPAFLPSLAKSVSTLGIRLADMGQYDQALVATQEAVDLYRSLAAENPAILSVLARVLNGLGVRLAEGGGSGGPAQVDRLWEEILGALDPVSAGMLLLYRSMDADPGDPAAAVWLVRALELVSEHPALTAALREEARRHLQPVGTRDGFEMAWHEATGTDLPGWATLDPVLLERANAWVDTPTFSDERDHLGAHPELLEPDATAVVEEALLAVPVEERDRLRRLREESRRSSPAVAYHDLVRSELLGRFVVGDPIAQQQMLNDSFEDLATAEARDALAAEAAGDSPRGIQVAAALLDLAQYPDHELLLVRAFAALNGDRDLATDLREVARGADADPLWPLAVIAVNTASTKAQAATALLYAAVAQAIAGDTKQAAETLMEARRLDPDERDAWIGDLGALATVHSEVVTLFPALTAPLRDDAKNANSGNADSGNAYVAGEESL